MYISDYLLVKTVNIFCCDFTWFSLNYLRLDKCAKFREELNNKQNDYLPNGAKVNLRKLFLILRLQLITQLSKRKKTQSQLISLYRSLSISLSLSYSFLCFTSHSLLSLSLSHSFSICLFSLNFFISLSLSLSLSDTTSQFLYLYLSLSLTLRLNFFISLSFFLYFFSPVLFISFSLCWRISLSFPPS